ncbi:MAG: RHS repeat-associated core domain-containing protein, partial [Bacteroidetes bacterium]|nr:RHS repeat-associated core domain-containing protein [Bacteroidota bacterium]
FYDPETGRYISADPIGLQGGINLYSYVQNDPINLVDPKGLMYYQDVVNDARADRIIDGYWINDQRENVGIALFNLNPRVDSDLEKQLIMHYFKSSGNVYHLTPNQWSKYQAALASNNNSYYDQGVGSVPVVPPSNGSIDSYDFDPFYAQWRTPTNNAMNMAAWILGPILGGDNFDIFGPNNNANCSPNL